MIINALVVDDDRASATTLSRLLERCGCTVLNCTDAQQAPGLSLGGDMDVVSLDLTMPGLDGYQVPGLIRSPPGLPRTSPSP